VSACRAKNIKQSQRKSGDFADHLVLLDGGRDPFGKSEKREVAGSAASTKYFAGDYKKK